MAPTRQPRQGFADKEARLAAQIRPRCPRWGFHRAVQLIELSHDLAHAALAESGVLPAAP